MIISGSQEINMRGTGRENANGQMEELTKDGGKMARFSQEEE